MRAPTLLALLATVAVASATLTVTVDKHTVTVDVSARAGTGNVALYHDSGLTLSQNIQARALGAAQGVADNTAATLTFANVPAGKFFVAYKPDGTGSSETTLASVPSSTCFSGADASTKVQYVAKGTVVDGDESDLIGNSLKLVFTEPARFADIQYEFQHGIAGKTGAIDATCNLVFGADSTTTGNVRWARNWASATGCTAKAVATIPNVNGQLGPCGWDRDESLVNSTVFRAIIKVTTVSQGVVIRRYLYTVTEETAVSLGLQYQSAVSASASTIIYGPAGLTGDLYGTYFNPAGTETFEVAFVTSVQKPYQLKLATSNKLVLAEPTKWDASISTVAGNADTKTKFHMDQLPSGLLAYDTNDQRAACLNIAGTDLAGASDANFAPVGGTGACTQFWHSVLTRGGTDMGCDNAAKEARYLNAEFTLKFDIDCDPSWLGACNKPEPSIAQFSVSTTSGNYCPQVLDSRSATAELRVYDSAAARATWTAAAAGEAVQSQFVFGTKSYFRVRMDSTGVTMYGAKAEQISVISGYKVENSGGTGMPRQIVYNKPFTSNAAWWTGKDDLTKKVGNVNGFNIAESDASASNQAVDFEWLWDNEISSASGDEPTDTQINYVGRVRWTTGGLSILSAKLTRTGTSALADGATSATARVGIAQPSSSSATAGSSAGVSSATIAIGAAVAGVALVAAGVAAHTVRSKRHDQARKTSHMASVALSIPEASAPTTA